MARPNAPQIEVDWTVDPQSQRSNSSREFMALTTKVDRLIRDSAHDLINGRTMSVALLIMAQLAHNHHLAPTEVSVQSAELNPEGMVRGMFTWNNETYIYEAKPVKP